MTFIPRIMHKPSLKRCHSGATALEFALIAPVLFLLLMGIIEFGLIFFTSSVLEGATSVGSRIGKTGYTVGERIKYLREEISRRSGGYLKAEDLHIDVLSYDSFENVGKPEECLTEKCHDPDAEPGVDFTDTNGDGKWSEDQGKTDDPGAGGATVLYRVTYPWPIFTPLMNSFFGDKGHYPIVAVATVRNEPF